MANPQMLVQLVSTGEQGNFHAIFPYDGIAEADGSSQFDTIQAMDDELDSAAYSAFVKTGTFTAGFTVSTNNVFIVVEPGTVIQGAITLSGIGITLVLGAQCDIQGLITLSGANCSLICQNGVDIDGILASGNFSFIDGGGWETLSNGADANRAISLTGTDCIAQNIAAQTDTGGSQIAIFGGGARTHITKCKVVDSGEEGIYVSGADSVIANCAVLGADGTGIGISAPRTIMTGCRSIAAGTVGIQVEGSGDNSVVVGNLVQDSIAASLVLSAGADNCVVVGNRLDGALTDSASGSTVASNNVVAF